MKTAKQKFQKVMHEFGQGKLMSHGKKVTDQKQAIAIAFSEARKVNKNYGMRKEGGNLEESILSSEDKFNKEIERLNAFEKFISQPFKEKFNTEYRREYEPMYSSDRKKFINQKREEFLNQWEEKSIMKDGGITEEQYRIIRRWADDMVTNEDINSILDAMVLSNITDADLHTPPTKTGTQYEKALDKKADEIYKRMIKNYSGNLKGNQPFSILYTLIDQNSRLNGKIIEQYKNTKDSNTNDKKYVIIVGETYDHSGGKALVERTYEKDGIPMVDYIYSNDKITKPETQTLRSFISTIQGETMEKGGTIKNQYQGKTAEQVWNDWTEQQRQHFYIDHIEMLPKAGSTKYIQSTYSEIPEQVKNVIQEHVMEGQYPKGGRIKLSPSKKKLQERIAKIKKAMASSKSAKAKDAMQKKIDKLQAEVDYNPSLKEKIAAQKGRFYLDVPTQYAQPIYRKLWSMGIKPELYKLNGNTKVVVNHTRKLEKAYHIYSDLLKEKGAMVPALSKIKGKL